MAFSEDNVNRLAIVSELVQFFWHNQWWWLTPIIVVLMAFAGLLIFAQSSAVAPFIYALF
jgi:hypothetical protein